MMLVPVPDVPLGDVFKCLLQLEVIPDNRITSMPTTFSEHDDQNTSKTILFVRCFIRGDEEKLKVRVAMWPSVRRDMVSISSQEAETFVVDDVEYDN